MLLIAPPQTTSVTVRAVRSGTTEYVVRAKGRTFKASHRLSPVAARVARDGTLWIVHRSDADVFVRAYNPWLGIDTISVPLRLSPSGWWDHTVKDPAVPNPPPPASPPVFGRIRALTPGDELGSGFSGGLRIPHEDGTRTDLVLLQRQDGVGHVFVAGKPLTPSERSVFKDFASAPTTGKIRLLRSPVPRALQISVPGETWLTTARILTRIDDPKGRDLAYVIDPYLAIPRPGMLSETIVSPGGE